uniref:50S ribosomal protein L9 n=1 Tax=Ascoseira mirabilis TaxID=76830 RepID=UPI003002F8CA|nr:50S ribosomal protein L9 [Ascoseira mirabilis]
MKKKSIEVILTQDVKNLGKQGNLVRVKSGYLRNYLVPLKLAKIVTMKLIKQFELKQKDQQLKQLRFIEKCNQIKNVIENIEKIIIKKNISEKGIFFGKITEKQILESIKNNCKLPIILNKNQLRFSPMKQLGNYTVEIILTTKVIAKIIFEILPE